MRKSATKSKGAPAVAVQRVVRRRQLPYGYKVKQMCDWFSVHDYTNGKFGEWMPATRSWSRQEAIDKFYAKPPNAPADLSRTGGMEQPKALPIERQRK